MNLSKNIFSDHYKCFFCNSTNLGDSISYEYRDNPYTLEIRKNNGLSIEELNANLLLKRCNNCQSLTFNRWFSFKVYEGIYKFAKHRMGWNRFLNTIYKNNSESIKNDIETFIKLTQQINKIDNYLEIRCPFMGMFPLFSLIKQPKRSNETLFNSKIYRLKLFFLKLIKKKNFSEGIYKDFKKIQIPNENIFLTDNSNKGWGDKCNNFGCNCKNILKEFKWIDTSNLKNFDPSQKNIDLLYIHNTLDHIEDPFVTLSKISSRVKNIYIKFHSIDGGAQHPFFLQNETINFIATRLNFKIKKFESENEYLLSK